MYDWQQVWKSDSKWETKGNAVVFKSKGHPTIYKT